MDPMLDEFTKFAASIGHSAPRIPIVSNLTGQIESGDIFDAQYWRDHVRNSVRFAEGVDRLVEEEVNVLIETGPAGTLIGMARRCHPEHSLAAIPSLKKGQQDATFLATAFAKAYVAGVELRWDRELDKPPRRVELPGYPLNEASYWFKPEHATTEFRDYILGLKQLTPMLGTRVAGPDSQLFQNRVSSYLPKHLGDHRVRADCVVPAAAFMDMALGVAREFFGTEEVSVESLQLPKALFLTERQKTLVTRLSGDSAARRRVEIFSRFADAEDAEAWELNASASIVRTSGSPSHLQISGDEVVATQIRELRRAQFYELVSERGLNYGPQYQVIDRLVRNEDSAFATTAIPEAVGKDLDGYMLHPSIGDGALQSMTGVVPLEENGEYCPDLYLPVAVRRLTRFAPVKGDVRYLVERTSECDGPSPDQVEADIFIADTQGKLLVALEGVRIQKISTAQREVSSDPQDWMYEVRWQPVATGQANSAEATLAEPEGEQPEEGKPETVAPNQHWLFVGPPSAFLNECQQLIAQQESLLSATLDTQSPADVTHLILSERQLKGTEACVTLDPKDAGQLRQWLTNWRSAQTANEPCQIVITHAPR